MLFSPSMASAVSIDQRADRADLFRKVASQSIKSAASPKRWRAFTFCLTTPVRSLKSDATPRSIANKFPISTCCKRPRHSAATRELSHRSPAQKPSLNPSPTISEPRQQTQERLGTAGAPSERIRMTSKANQIFPHGKTPLFEKPPRAKMNKLYRILTFPAYLLWPSLTPQRSSALRLRSSLGAHKESASAHRPKTATH